MAASVSGAKTCTNDASPTENAARLTVLLAIAPENMTVAQLKELLDACQHVSSGDAETAVVGTILV